ncbi:uncharacterized protein F4822DRAFT_394168 [Hypoxylon trugodes]|uniref:uncharacterized protein n=1 Tax=Hypoxylon trugodes TaxID=326681 RepID=UPI0021923252|nr:uncharacterized protein F4822DRAFT_394168 [Hypoxylon trugodes]KAI1390689.1 hypothetical protein F4822DRAFT_394168 [Hypoxylon trugodes]
MDWSMTSSKKPTPTFNFLDLPPTIRRRIYEIAGLLVGKVLRLIPTRNDPLYPYSQRTIESLQFTYSILQTCKTINTEVTIIIYSQNAFVVVHDYVYYGLGLLHLLNPLQCSALTHLSIQLHLEDAIDCHTDHIPESSSRHLDPDANASWQATARHVLSHVTPQTLYLQLFCDVGVSDTTQAVLQPLRDIPGVLKDCELQLSHEKGNRHLRAMALEVATRAKGFDPDLRASPFRFFDLPAEIRRNILEFSDLVAPYNEIYWNADQGFSISVWTFRCWGDNCDEHLHRGCPFIFCADFYPVSTGNICYQLRSGYSSHCHCWEIPRALLLANRSLHREALQVLYGCNRIIVLPSEGPAAFSTPQFIRRRLDISKFITKHMRPESLHYLRTIEFVFPPLTFESNLVSDESYALDLDFAIDHLKRYADIPKLTVVACMATVNIMRDGDSKAIHRELINSGGDIASVLRTHTRMLDSLRGFQGMRGFFVHLEWTWHWFLMHQVVGSSLPDSFDGEIDRMEAWLEKHFMGNNYNSKAVGKMNLQPSVWLYNIWHTLQYLWWSHSTRIR